MRCTAHRAGGTLIKFGLQASAVRPGAGQNKVDIGGLFAGPAPSTLFLSSVPDFSPGPPLSSRSPKAHQKIATLPNQPQSHPLRAHHTTPNLPIQSAQQTRYLMCFMNSFVPTGVWVVTFSTMIFCAFITKCGGALFGSTQHIHRPHPHHHLEWRPCWLHQQQSTHEKEHSPPRGAMHLLPSAKSCEVQ